MAGATGCGKGGAGRGKGAAGRGKGGAGRGKGRAGRGKGVSTVVCEELILITDITPRSHNIITQVQAVFLGGGFYDVNVPRHLSLSLAKGLFYQVEVSYEILHEEDHHATRDCTLLRIIQLLGSRRGFLNMITVYDDCDDSESMESSSWDEYL